MKIIGVTGGIGSGKSTVSSILSKLGAKVIDADRLARDIVKRGEPAFNKIVNQFGSKVLDSNGELDRTKLSGIVFEDKIKLQELNDITHKYVADKIIELIKKYDNSNTIVIDAPIPIEHGFLDIVDEVWVVHADTDIRIKRVMERNSLPYEDVKKRIQVQLSAEEYLKLADVVIYNNGSYSDIESDVRKFF